MKNNSNKKADYNGGGDKKYKDKVLTIFKTGKTIDELKLWSLGILIAIGLVSILGLNIGLRNYTDSTLQNLQTATAIQSELFKSYRSSYVSQYNSAVIANKILETFRKVNKDPLKNAIFRTFTEDDQNEIEDIKSFPYDSSLFATIIEYQKDWWEDIEIGRIDNGKITWLEVDNFPHENSILSAKWIKLDDVNTPILEVYAETHMGNGDIYLYKVTGNKATLFFATFAVSGYWSLGDLEDNIKKYGYTECGETYLDGQLFSKYSDLNNDGISDLTLTGTNIITCDKATAVGMEINAKSEDIEVFRSKIKKTYLLDLDKICVPDKYYIYTCK